MRHPTRWIVLAGLISPHAGWNPHTIAVLACVVAAIAHDVYTTSRAASARRDKRSASKHAKPVKDGTREVKAPCPGPGSSTSCPGNGETSRSP